MIRAWSLLDSSHPFDSAIDNFMLAAAVDSRFEQHNPLPPPHFNITYQLRDFRAMREMGAPWKIITENMPQPTGINPGGPQPKR